MKIFLLLFIYMVSLYALNDTYTGLIHKDKITMSIDINQKKITGSYSYDSNPSKIKVSGEIINNAVLLDTYNKKGEMVSRFFGLHDNNTASINGTWIEYSSQKSFPFSLKSNSSPTQTLEKYITTNTTKPKAIKINEDTNIAEYNNLKVYGVDLKTGNSNTEDKSYLGVGIQYENDFSNIVFEHGSKYKKGSAVVKGDINKDFYVKVGLGYLQRNMLVEEKDTDVTQISGGGSLGFGDDKSYNLEAGYLISQLKNAALADGYSKISYLELIGKHSFAKYATFDIVGVYQNSKVFDKNYKDYQAELGWFTTDDLRTHLAYDSVKHNKNDYTVRAGVQYTFGTGEFSPYLQASLNSDKNMKVGVKYSRGIINKSLKMRDQFENVISTSTIIAQTVAPTVFATKVAKLEPIVIPAPAVNHAPTGSSGGARFVGSIGVFDLTPVINDPDGDIMTINITRTRNETARLGVTVSIIDKTITVRVDGTPHGNYIVYYTVSDGTSTSPEYYIGFSPAP